MRSWSASACQAASTLSYALAPFGAVRLRAASCCSVAVIQRCAGDSGGGRIIASIASSWLVVAGDAVPCSAATLKKRLPSPAPSAWRKPNPISAAPTRPIPIHAPTGSVRARCHNAAPVPISASGEKPPRSTPIERFQHLLRAAVTGGRGLRQCLVDEALPVAQFQRQARDRILRVHHRHRQRIGGAVRKFAGQHLPGEHADAVQVGAAVDFLATRLLRRHVGGAADREAGGGDARVDALAQRDAEVGEQWTVGFVEKYIFGLDVAMHDATHVRVVECAQQRAQRRDHARLVAGATCLLGDAQAEVAARQVRHRVIRQRFGSAADLEDADDVGMIQPRDGAGLVLEASTADFVGQRFGQHHLDRDLAAQRLLLGQVHRRHAAMADHAQQSIAADFRQCFAYG